MEYFSLLTFHIFFAILWAGGAISAGFFFAPAILEAGPGGGVVMAGLVKRRFPIAMTIFALIVVLTGIRLYMLRFSVEWLTSPEGLALTLGGLLGLGALVIGLFVQKPAAEKLGSLAAQIAAAGTPPTPAQAAEMAALRQRLGRIARVLAWHLMAAAILMASHRLLAAF